MDNDARVLVALGSNLPYEGRSGTALIARAVSALEAAGLAVRKRSGVWRTAPWPPDASQPDYVNAVVELDPEGLVPQPLYQSLCEIERDFGRERRERWAARTLDLDILAVGRRVGRFDGVELPHPRLHERAFVLAPLAEAAPGWRHPVLDRTAAEMLDLLPGWERSCRRLGELA